MNRTVFFKLTVVRQVTFAVFRGNVGSITLFTRAHHSPRPDSNECGVCGVVWCVFINVKLN